jgi:hypothetical protein
VRPDAIDHGGANKSGARISSLERLFKSRFGLLDRSRGGQDVSDPGQMRRSGIAFRDQLVGGKRQFERSCGRCIAGLRRFLILSQRQEFGEVLY